MRDAITGLAVRGALGPTLNSTSTGYGAVYQLEILLLFATLMAIGPLVRSGTVTRPPESDSYGWAEFPN
jgi:BCD family chlorophyll transporter-like MFS transporter